MSTTIITVFVLLLSQVLPLIGVHLGDEALQSFIQTLVAIVGGLWIWYRRVAKGDVNALGAMKR